MGMGGMGMGGMGGQMAQVGGAGAGYVMLFRFLDFDVNPGEAYRYRVQLELTNPNYELPLDQVKEQAVKEGETRTTGWSEPTAPVVVKPDTNFFLAKVDKRARNRGEAEFEIFQWDAALGTYIDSKKLVAKFGQFIGGLEESDRLDVATPSLEKKTVLFATKDFLLDTSLPPALIPSENPDLNLTATGRQAKDGIDLPAEAAVLDEYGQLLTLDSVSARKDALQEEDKVKKERAPFESLRESEKETTNGLDAAAAPSAAAMMMPMMGMGSMSSNLKRGGSKTSAGAAAKGKRGGYPRGGMTSADAMMNGPGTTKKKGKNTPP